MEIIFVSGMSGSGKTVALHLLEDVGYTSIDNFPIRLLSQYVEEEVSAGRGTDRRIALGIDARAGEADLMVLPRVVDDLRRQGVSCEVLFLTSDEDVLVRRYSETRRRHPLAGNEEGLLDAIREEREVLSTVVDCADLVIDTTHLNVHDLREMIRKRLRAANPDAAGIALMFMSFGFKHGVPRDADFVFDVRCLPNPHWDSSLRPLTGRDGPVQDYLDAQPSVEEMIDDIRDFLSRWLRRFEAADRSYLTVAIGCTGGRHRSVYVAERLGAWFGKQNERVLVRHSSLDELLDIHQLDLALAAT
ncbi:MAG: RNase adapter RapZ, partial [Gammaproteobacteria bacterium]|nr:RNase adapter RapZ [Gammaproteobacteria bacterium]